MKRYLLPALAVVFFAAIYVLRIGEDMVDFEVNHRAGGRLLAGESLYRTGDGHFVFKYFPFAAGLYAPLALLPLGAAKAVWYALTAASTVAIFVLSKRLVSGREREPWWVLALPPVVLAKFCLRELKLGQINTLVTFVLLIMVLGLVAERRREAGGLFGLATALKPYGLIFLPYLVARQVWAGLLAGLLALAAAGLLPSVFYGLSGNIELHREWFLTLSQSTPAQLAVNDNVSIVGALTKWLDDDELARRLAIAVVLALAAAVLLAIRRGRDLPRAPVLEGALLLTLIPLVSPLGWDYQLLTSVLALTLLAHHWLELPRPYQWALGVCLFVSAFSIYDVIGRDAYHAFMEWSVLTPCYLVVAACLFHLRWRRLC